MTTAPRVAGTDSSIDGGDFPQRVGTGTKEPAASQPIDRDNRETGKGGCVFDSPYSTRAVKRNHGAGGVAMTPVGGTTESKENIRVFFMPNGSPMEHPQCQFSNSGATGDFERNRGIGPPEEET